MTDSKGKIIITTLNKRLLSLLIQNSQILSIQVHRPNNYALGNIYIGRIQNISKNIEAAFVDLGKGYLTFLPLAESKYAFLTNRKPDGSLKTGDELLVQLVKEPMKTKLAGVTTDITLSGNYAVVGRRSDALQKGCPLDKQAAAPICQDISKESCEEGIVQVSNKLGRKQQDRFRNITALKQIAAHYRLIVRTNAGALTEEEPLTAEAQLLTKQLEHILQTASGRTCYSCLYHTKPEYLHFIENTYKAQYDEIITDLPPIYQALQEHLLKTDIPLRFYEDSMLPLYKLYSLEIRIKELLDKRVWLKSGGYLVIEPTEALVSIDVNSGKCERGRDQEETFLKINLEAARMIALHLRARNLSGIILVDFINLKQKEHIQQLIESMRSLLKKDSVTADVVDMTGLGLMEITRKKVNPSFYEQYHKTEEESFDL